jgi:hypothetical protein
MNTAEELDQLGVALHEAAVADLNNSQVARRRRSRPRLRLALIAVAVALAVPATGFAFGLFTMQDEQRALPAGSALFIGTNPTCTVVEAGVRYTCVLATAPRHESAADWKGGKFPTVDASSRINGGCIGLSSDGLHWNCYIGQAAVGRVIDRGVLGTIQNGPSHG